MRSKSRAVKFEIDVLTRKKLADDSYTFNDDPDCINKFSSEIDLEVEKYIECLRESPKEFYHNLMKKVLREFRTNL